MTYQLPTLNAVALPRPTSANREREDSISTRTLGNGDERRYVRGYRYIYTLAWASLTEAQVASVVAACHAAMLTAVAYVHVDGTAGTVYVSSSPSPQPIPATEPVRAALAIELREQNLRRA